MTKKNLKTIIFILKLAATVLIAFLVVYNLDMVELRYIVKNAVPGSIAAAFLLLPVNIYLQYAKWNYLVGIAADEKVPAPKVLTSVFLGISLGFITPGKAGEPAKLFFVSKNNRLRLLSMGIFEKVYDVFPVLIFGMLSIPFLPDLFFNTSSFMHINLIFFSALSVLLLYFIAVHPGIFRSVLNYFRNSMFSESDRFGRFVSGFDRIGKKQSRVLFALSTLLFLTYTTQFALLISAFGNLHISMIYTGVWVSIFIKTFLPVSLGDIGVREGVAAYVFSLIGLPREAAVSAAFLLFAINILLPSAVSVFLIPFAKVTDNGKKRDQRSADL